MIGGAAVPDGVGEQVGQDALQAARVGGDHGAGVDVHLRVGGEGGRPACGEVAEGDVGQGGAFGGGVQAGHLQHVLDEGAQRLDPVLDDVGHPPRRQEFGGGGQAGERGTQLVGDVGGDPAFGLQPGLQGLGHGVDGVGEFGGLVVGAAADRRADPDGVITGADMAGGGRGPPQPARQPPADGDPGVRVGRDRKRARRGGG